MLVVIDGVPAIRRAVADGAVRGRGRDAAGGNATRAVDFRQATADPLVGALSLAEATERLTDGLARLPDLGETAPELMGARPRPRAAATSAGSSSSITRPSTARR